MRFRLPAAALLVLVAPALSAPGPEAASRPRLSAQDDAVRPLLAKMTLDEKIGQMTQADQQFLVEERDIETYFLGSLLSGGDSDPKTNRLEDWTEMVERYQSHTGRTRLKIPLLYGVDAVHGHSNVLGAVIFPHSDGVVAQENGEITLAGPNPIIWSGAENGSHGGPARRRGFRSTY